MGQAAKIKKGLNHVAKIMTSLNKTKPDMVNHPPHYTDGKIEVIDYIDDKNLGYCLGCAVKYISRAGKKGGPEKAIEDLKKAVWYLNHEIEKREATEKKSIKS